MMRKNNISNDDAFARYTKSLLLHYKNFWGSRPGIFSPTPSDAAEFPIPFAVVEFDPNRRRNSWVYATCGMGLCQHSPAEFFVISPYKSRGLGDILAAIGHYHLTGTHLNHGHIVNLGVPWLDASACTFSLISRPYLYGPAMQNFIYCESNINCLWVIPIRQDEREFAVKNGVDRLEDKFEEKSFNYMDPLRPSVLG